MLGIHLSIKRLFINLLMVALTVSSIMSCGQQPQGVASAITDFQKQNPLQGTISNIELLQFDENYFCAYLTNLGRNQMSRLQKLAELNIPAKDQLVERWQMIAEQKDSQVSGPIATEGFVRNLAEISHTLPSHKTQGQLLILLGLGLGALFLYLSAGNFVHADKVLQVEGIAKLGSKSASSVSADIKGLAELAKGLNPRHVANNTRKLLRAGESILSNTSGSVARSLLRTDVFIPALFGHLLKNPQTVGALALPLGTAGLIRSRLESQMFSSHDVTKVFSHLQHHASKEQYQEFRGLLADTPANLSMRCPTTEEVVNDLRQEDFKYYSFNRPELPKRSFHIENFINSIFN